MTTTLDSLEVEALKLSVEERAKLAQTLWDSLSGGPQEVDERQAIADAKRRDAEMAAGTDPGESHSAVMRAARRALK